MIALVVALLIGTGIGLLIYRYVVMVDKTIIDIDKRIKEEMNQSKKYEVTMVDKNDKLYVVIVDENKKLIPVWLDNGAYNQIRVMKRLNPNSTIYVTGYHKRNTFSLVHISDIEIE